MKKLTGILTMIALMMFAFLTSAFAEEEQFEYVVPCKWRFIGVYSEGYATLDASSPDYKKSISGYVNKFGKVRMLPDGYSSASFEDGIATLYITPNTVSSQLIGYVYMNHNWEFTKHFTNDEYDAMSKEKKKLSMFKIQGIKDPVKFYGNYAIVEGRMKPEDRGHGYYVIDKNGTGIIRFYDKDSDSSDPRKKLFVISEDNNTLWIRDSHNSFLKSLPFGKDPSILDGVEFVSGYDSNTLIVKKDTPEGEKWGAFDSHFNLIIPFEYEELGAAKSRLINAKKDGKWGYIDLHNKVVVDFQFDNALPFAEERGSVCLNGLYGVIRLRDDGPLDSSRTAVDTAYPVKININNTEKNVYQIGNKTYLPIDMLQDHGFNVAINASETIIDMVKSYKKDRDTDTYIVEEKENYTVYQTDARVFLDKRIVLGSRTDDDFIILPTVQIDDSFAVELNMLSDYGTIWEQDGKQNIVFDSPYLPNEGITWEWIDFAEDLNRNDPYTPVPHEYPLLKIEGREDTKYFGYSTKGTYKFYDENDNVVLDKNWDDAYPFMKGTALVNEGAALIKGRITGGKWGLINTAGEYLVEPVWDKAYRARDDSSIVFGMLPNDNDEQKMLYGLADKNGNILIPAEHEHIDIMKDSKYAVIDDRLFKGVLDLTNQVVFPTMFGTDRVIWLNVMDAHLKVKINKKEYMVKFIDKPVLRGNIFANGTKIEFDTSPLLINDRTMVPARAVFESLGYSVDWNDETHTVLIHGQDCDMKVFQDKNVFEKNGMYLYSDTSALNFEDRIYLPLRAVTESIGCRVNYDDITGDILIEY